MITKSKQGSVIIIAIALIATMLITAVAVSFQINQIRQTTAPRTKQPSTSTNLSSKPNPSPPVSNGTIHTTPESSDIPPLAGSGIKGQIYSGSATGCFSEDPNSSCNKPRIATGTIEIRTINASAHTVGEVISTVKSNSSGYYIVSMTAGSYQVQLKSASTAGSSTAVVNVKPGEYATADLMAF